jgi:hypothetical protein
MEFIRKEIRAAHAKSDAGFIEAAKAGTQRVSMRE